MPRRTILEGRFGRWMFSSYYPATLAVYVVGVWLIAWAPSLVAGPQSLWFFAGMLATLVWWTYEALRIHRRHGSIR